MLSQYPCNPAAPTQTDLSAGWPKVVEEWNRGVDKIVRCFGKHSKPGIDNLRDTDNLQARAREENCTVAEIIDKQAEIQASKEKAKAAPKKKRLTA